VNHPTQSAGGVSKTGKRNSLLADEQHPFWFEGLTESSHAGQRVSRAAALISIAVIVLPERKTKFTSLPRSRQ
jgi:hypothetical protein